MYIMSRSFEHFGFENDPWVHGRNLKEKMCISWNWLSSLDFSTFCILIILKGYCVTLKYPGTASIYLPVKVKAQRAKLWPRRQRFLITYSAPIINSPFSKNQQRSIYLFCIVVIWSFQNSTIVKLWFFENDCLDFERCTNPQFWGGSLWRKSYFHQFGLLTFYFTHKRRQ